MGIRFIFGRAGSGKSEFCLRSIDKKISLSYSTPYTDSIFLKIGISEYDFPLS